MKKCPYCAEEIQDEAIYCRYCSRDLPQQPSNTEEGLPLVKKKNINSKQKRSIWGIGAIWAVLLSGLVAIRELSTTRANPFFTNIIDFIVNFLFWWLIFTFLTWLWRKIRWYLLILIIGLILIAVVIIGYKFNSLTTGIPEIIGATSTSTSIHTNTLNPSATKMLIKYSNKCAMTITTAIYYQDTSGNWVTKGWWTIEAGESAYVAYTINPTYFYYGYSPDGSAIWEGDDTFQTVNGSNKVYGFRELTIPNWEANLQNWGYSIQNWTCQ